MFESYQLIGYKIITDRKAWLAETFLLNFPTMFPVLFPSSKFCLVKQEAELSQTMSDQQS